MHAKHNRILAGTLCALLASSPAIAVVGDWQPELVAPASGARGPGDPVRMRLPELSLAVLQRLALELDDVDVTGFVRREGDFAIFTPPQPLAFGEHRLRLIEYAADGSILERAVWTVEVRQGALLREAQFQAAATLNLERRIAEDGLTQPEPDPNRASGGARLQGTAADGDWRLSGYADLIYNSQLAMMPRGARGERTDIGHYLFAYEHGPVVAYAGHHNVAPDSLVLSGFTRRGVSVGMHTVDQGASLTAFSVRTQDIIGFHEGLGIGDGENRTDGVVVSGRPAWGGNSVALSAIYLNGAGPLTANPANAPGAATPPTPIIPPSGTAGDPTPVRGSAGSVVADSLLLGKHIRLRGEYAVSRFDPDGDGRDADLDGVIDSNLEPERDDAYSALLTYVPWHEQQVGGKPFFWQFGVENKRLGTWFKSLANPFGVSDRLLYRAFTGVDWSGLNLQVSVGQETDNVNEVVLLPRVETRQNLLSLTYTPFTALAPRADGSLPPPPWYGQPLFNMSYVGANQDVVRAADTTGLGALNEMRTLAFSVSSAYPTWHWSLGHTIGTYENFLDNTPDSETASSQLSVSLRFGQRLTFTPYIQYSSVRESDPPVGMIAGDSDTLMAALTLGYILSENVSSSLAYNVYRIDATNDILDSRTSDVRASISWVVVPPQGLRPGLTLSLDGQYRDTSQQQPAVTPGVVGVPAQAVLWDGYQVFLKASIGWLPSFGMN